MKRTREECVNKEWIYGLPDEIWVHEILGHFLLSPAWPRTSVMLRRTCKWFAGLIRVNLSPKSILEESSQLAQRREWWPALGFRIELPAMNSSDYLLYSDTLRSLIKDYKMPAFWLMFGSMITQVATSRDSFWHLSDNVKVIQELWQHFGRDDSDVAIQILSKSLETRNLEVYLWITDVLLRKRNLKGYSTLLPVWEKLVIETGLKGEKAWAKGYYNIFIKNPYLYPSNAPDAKNFWEIVTQWAKD